MSHDTAHDHAAEHATDHGHDHVEDTVATRLLGIMLGVILIVTAVGIQHAMHWHPVVGGIITGIFGMLFGAGGTSARGPHTAAVLGWAGGIAFFTSIAMFFGLRIW